jgi:uncharacterized protein YjbI with pentapeptide repeats
MQPVRPILFTCVALLAMACVSAHAQTTIACPEQTRSGPGENFRGRDLSLRNFSRLSLVNADFRGAILKGTMFIGADLRGADFSGATFVDSGSPVKPNDFSFADLGNACFIGARFQARTYFTYASLGCTDFSRTDLANGNALFGDSPLRVAPLDTCRASFREVTMSCESPAQWRVLDLTNANLAHCAADGRLRNLDLSDALMDGVDLNQADLQGVKLMRAQLHGANLSFANLLGADLTGAQLGVAPGPGSGAAAANLTGAYLRDADLTSADLRSVSLAKAHIYGNPAKSKLLGALLDSADLSGAVLAGAHFSGSLTNANFDGAQLVDAIFSGATLTGAKFHSAYLQGADFSKAAAVTGVVLDNAAVSTKPGSWTLKEQDGTPYTYHYEATKLGAIATDRGAYCPNNASSPCDTPAKLVPSDTGPYPPQPPCVPLPRNYDNCPPPGKP